MKSNFFTLAFLLLASVATWAQASLTGTVTDEKGEPLGFAVVKIGSAGLGTSTDVDGNYSLENIPAGTYQVEASYIGYGVEKVELTFTDGQAASQNFTLGSDALGLTEVVVTGVQNGKSKLESSVSVSSLSPTNIDMTVSRTTAEIFRSIPGVRSEASGGEGNTNITVRGVPISSGGSKYLQLQEDGLPVLLFGDIAFATSDIFLRADQSVARIEAIRGGSASVLASNSPAGIINFISNTGSVRGGAIGTTFGLDHNNFRTDFNFGSPIGDDMSFHIGGFFRTGEGVRTAGYSANNGGQIKANFTKRFENGYARVYYKFLNDRAAAYMPMPMQVSGTNASPNWESAPGYDASNGAMQSPYLMQNLGIGPDGQLRRSNVSDGMHPVSHSFGAEFSFDLGNDWKIEDRARMSFNSGRFVAPFPAEIGTGAALAASVGTLLGNDPQATLAYANPADSNDVFNNNNLALRIHMFDTELNNFNNFVNDIKVSKKISLFNISLGFYKAQQNINMSWLWNSYLTEVNGNGARLLNVLDSNGVVMTDNGLYAYGVPAWGNCCQRNYNTQYGVSAPYLGVEAQVTEDLNIEAGLRWDMGRVTGNYAGAVQTTFDVNNDGNIGLTEQSVSAIDNAATMPVNYKYSYLSYSFGANYRIKEDIAIFARYSHGASAKADRILFSPTVYSDGSAQATLDFVSQGELGLKYRFSKGGIFLTGFYARTNEQGGFEATTQTLIENDYVAGGVELEAAAKFGGFDVRGSVTYTNAKITSGANEGNRPRRQSPFIFNLNPSYTYKGHTLGINVIGTGKAYAQDNNQLVFPAYAVFNAYLSVKVFKGLSAVLSVNNAFNSKGITESEEGSITENAVNYVRARPILGRSITASVRYTF